MGYCSRCKTSAGCKIICLRGKEDELLPAMLGNKGLFFFFLFRYLSFSANTGRYIEAAQSRVETCDLWPFGTSLYVTSVQQRVVIQMTVHRSVAVKVAKIAGNREYSITKTYSGCILWRRGTRDFTLIFFSIAHLDLSRKQEVFIWAQFVEDRCNQ